MSLPRPARGRLGPVLALAGTLALVASALPVWGPPSLEAPSSTPRPWAAGELEWHVSGPARPCPTLDDGDAPPELRIERDADTCWARYDRASVVERLEAPLGRDVLEAISTPLRGSVEVPTRLPGDVVEVELESWTYRTDGEEHSVDGLTHETRDLGIERVPGDAEAYRTLSRHLAEDGFVYVLRHAGGPVRVGGPTLIDRDTGVARGTLAFSRQVGERTIGWVESVQRHRAANVLVVPIAHGDPWTGRLRLEVGQTVELGERVRLEVLASGPGWIDGSSWSVDFSGVHVASADPDERSRWGLVRCWPPEQRTRLQYRRSPEGRWSSFNGRDCLLHLESIAAAADGSAPEIELRLFPDSHRVSFELPGHPDLPVVPDLFDLELEHFRCDHEPELMGLLDELLLGRSEGVRTSELPEDLFPLRLRDTTPREVAAWVEEHRGRALGWDRRRVGFLDRPRTPLMRWLGLPRP